jgi:hypothetical protein
MGIGYGPGKGMAIDYLKLIIRARKAGFKLLKTHG